MVFLLPANRDSIAALQKSIIRYRVDRFTLSLAAALIAVLPGVLAASPQSHELIMQGSAQLEAGRHSEALKRFDTASRSDPTDSEAVFFQGAALNRLRQPKAANEKLQQAARMGYRGVGLTFETGWALLRLRRWADAVEQFEYFEIVAPGRGKTSEFLGRAYLALGDFAGAEAKLREAVERDPRVKPTVLVYLAVLEDKRGHPQQARQYLETIIRDAPSSPIARAVAGQLKTGSFPAKKVSK
ncbi:MAG TPA: tetratricopeptide repeat protein [Candidatus Binatia bacterium]